MLNPKYKKYADRISALIEESNRLLTKQVSNPIIGGDDYIPNNTEVFAWKVKVENILEIVFSENSPHVSNYSQVLKSWSITSVGAISRIRGVLIGALDDLNNGFLQGQEFFIAIEVFDSILEQAKYLNDNHYKDPGAILCRVVLEDALKRLAREESINDSQKASKLNDDLKTAKKINQPQWRQNQVWLDIGNNAAHGKFDTYDEKKVDSMIHGITVFLANEFN